MPIFFREIDNRVFEHANKLLPDNFALLFRISHAFQRVQKSIGRIDIFQAHVKIFAEHALHHFFLARAQQSVVHENAGKLVADRLVQTRRGDR